MGEEPLGAHPPKTIARARVLEDQAAHLDIELLRIGQVIDCAERLVLAGRLDDERAESEQPANWRPLEAHIRDLGQRHHAHGLLEYAAGGQKPRRRYYEVVFEPRVDLEKQPN